MWNIITMRRLRPMGNFSAWNLYRRLRSKVAFQVALHQLSEKISSTESFSMLRLTILYWYISHLSGIMFLIENIVGGAALLREDYLAQSCSRGCHESPPRTCYRSHKAGQIIWRISNWLFQIQGPVDHLCAWIDTVSRGSTEAFAALLALHRRSPITLWQQMTMDDSLSCSKIVCQLLCGCCW